MSADDTRPIHFLLTEFGGQCPSRDAVLDKALWARYEAAAERYAAIMRAAAMARAVTEDKA